MFYCIEYTLHSPLKIRTNESGRNGLVNKRRGTCEIILEVAFKLIRFLFRAEISGGFWVEMVRAWFLCQIVRRLIIAELNGDIFEVRSLRSGFGGLFCPTN